MPYFVQGLTMGLAYVAPIGVQNLFVIHSALAHPRRRALATAGIVIFFDVTLALACFFGAGAVMQRSRLPQGPKRCPPPLWSPGAIPRRSLTAP